MYTTHLYSSLVVLHKHPSVCTYPRILAKANERSLSLSSSILNLKSPNSKDQSSSSSYDLSSVPTGVIINLSSKSISLASLSITSLFLSTLNLWSGVHFSSRPSINVNLIISFSPLDSKPSEYDIVDIFLSGHHDITFSIPSSDKVSILLAVPLGILTKVSPVKQCGFMIISGTKPSDVNGISFC